MFFAYLRRRLGIDQLQARLDALPSAAPAPPTPQQGDSDLAHQIAGLHAAFEGLAAHLRERDAGHRTWTKENAIVISKLRDSVIGHLDSFERRLSADIRTRTGQAAVAAPAMTADESLVAQRRYGLAGPTSDLELEGLLALMPWVSDDHRVAATLLRAVRDSLREIYPPENRWPTVIATRSGLQLEMDLADIFAATLAFGWLQEADDFATFMALVEPGDVVVDVGANFGLYAAHAAHYVGAGGRVVAFEPAPDTFALLAGNMQRNGLGDRSVCLRQGVAAKPGKAAFHVARDGAFSGLRDTGRSPTVDVTEVELAALDLAPALEGAVVDMMKIDVEGAEGGVLAGARALIDRSPGLIIMMEFSHKNLDAAGRELVLGELARLVGSGFVIATRGRDGRELQTLSLEDLQGERNDNLFLCRAGSPELRRLREAVASTPQRAISPAEAAAIALLKRQAAGL